MLGAAGSPGDYRIFSLSDVTVGRAPDLRSLVGRTVLQEMVNVVELVFVGQAVVSCPGGSDRLAGDGSRRRTRCSWARLLSSVLVGRTVLQEMVNVVELVFVGQAVVFCPGGSNSLAGDGPPSYKLVSVGQAVAFWSNSLAGNGPTS